MDLAEQMIALGAWRVSHGEMSIEALLIVLMADTEAFRPLRDLRSLLHRGMVADAAVVGIKTPLKTIPPRPPRQTEETPTLQPSIGFEAVHFSYSDERGEALKGISFKVKAGAVASSAIAVRASRPSSSCCCDSTIPMPAPSTSVAVR